MTAPDHVVEPLNIFLRERGHPYMALRDEGPYRGGCRLGAGTHAQGHRCERSRRHPDGGAIARAEEEDVFGDAGYTGADKRPELEDRDVSWNIAIKRGI